MSQASSTCCLLPWVEAGRVDHCLLQQGAGQVLLGQEQHFGATAQLQAPPQRQQQQGLSPPAREERRAAPSEIPATAQQLRMFLTFGVPPALHGRLANWYVQLRPANSPCLSPWAGPRLLRPTLTSCLPGSQVSSSCRWLRIQASCVLGARSRHQPCGLWTYILR